MFDIQYNNRHFVFSGEFWLEVGAPEDLKLAHVSVGTNAVWAVTRDQRVWFRKGVRGESAGVNEELARGSGWVEMVGSMAVVSVAANDQVCDVCDELFVDSSFCMI
jgi:tectonin beta-propeller repeat-containing protein 1